MPTLQPQVAKSLEGLTDDNLMFLLDMINRFMKPAQETKAIPADDIAERPIGMFKNEKFYSDGYDIDEDNDEIAGMFGVMG